MEVAKELFKEFKKFCFKDFSRDFNLNFKQKRIPFPLVNWWFATYFNVDKSFAKAMLKEWEKSGLVKINRKGIYLRR